jgi:hypothetical protein
MVSAIIINFIFPRGIAVHTLRPARLSLIKRRPEKAAVAIQISFVGNGVTTPPETSLDCGNKAYLFFQIYT